MPNWRRFYLPGAIVFVTGVTHQRLPYLGPEEDLSLFWDTLRRVQAIHPFRLLAHVTLPEHFHWLLRVDDGEGDFSAVLHSVKRNYTQSYKKAHGIRGHLQVWQRGFWDHVIREEKDLARHFDYIHWNPVKHGYVQRPEDWQHSTYRYWLGLGYYEMGWGHVAPASIEGMEQE